MRHEPNFWTADHVRADAFKAIVDADETSIMGAIASVDNAIATALVSHGYPRGEIRSITLVDGFTSWLARKSPDCVMSFSRFWFHHWIEQLRQPDGITGAWIHEGIHARAPFGSHAEYEQWMGYEEGLAEGLTGIIMAARGIRHVNQTFGYYVSAYVEIAKMMSIETEALLRTLWQYPLGGVRLRFVDAIDGLLVESGRDRLSSRSRLRWQLAADAVFSSTRHQSQFNRDAVREVLERIVR